MLSWLLTPSGSDLSVLRLLVASVAFWAAWMAAAAAVARWYFRVYYSTDWPPPAAWIRTLGWCRFLLAISPVLFAVLLAFSFPRAWFLVRNQPVWPNVQAFILLFVIPQFVIMAMHYRSSGRRDQEARGDTDSRYRATVSLVRILGVIAACLISALVGMVMAGANGDLLFGTTLACGVGSVVIAGGLYSRQFKPPKHIKAMLLEDTPIWEEIQAIRRKCRLPKRQIPLHRTSDMRMVFATLDGLSVDFIIASEVEAVTAIMAKRILASTEPRATLRHLAVQVILALVLVWLIIACVGLTIAAIVAWFSRPPNPYFPMLAALALGVPFLTYRCGRWLGYFPPQWLALQGAFELWRDACPCEHRTVADFAARLMQFEVLATRTFKVEIILTRYWRNRAFRKFLLKQDADSGEVFERARRSLESYIPLIATDPAVMRQPGSKASKAD
ncbi:MAG: hypothetical protein K1X53_11410 [Candidatus Sumerlaeaceae bacterium]|nr:hypothetical protein [Candidatus Sumerlaeaceae bacterium]